MFLTHAPSSCSPASSASCQAVTQWPGRPDSRQGRTTSAPGGRSASQPPHTATAAAPACVDHPALRRRGGGTNEARPAATPVGWSYRPALGAQRPGPSDQGSRGRGRRLRSGGLAPPTPPSPRPAAAPSFRPRTCHRCLQARPLPAASRSRPRRCRAATGADSSHRPLPRTTPGH